MMKNGNEIDIDELRRVLIEAAGEDEDVDLSGDISESSFEDLGYDSLALLEAASQISDEFGVEIPDDELFEIKTPNELLATVRKHSQ